MFGDLGGLLENKPLTPEGGTLAAWVCNIFAMMGYMLQHLFISI